MITDEIFENQRRHGHLPGLLKSDAVAEALNVGLDQQYSKANLLPNDPSPWTDSSYSTVSSPGAYPLKEVMILLLCGQS